MDHWFDWLLGVTTLILGAIGKRLQDRMDRLDQNAVTRSELQELVKQMNAERRHMHAENRGMLERIHDRVDTIFSRLAQ